MNFPLSEKRRAIRVGTLIRAEDGVVESIAARAGEGFESFQVAFSLKRLEVVPALESLAGPARDTAAGQGAVISALGVYGNPLRGDAAGEAARDGIRRSILSASAFGTGVVGCFAGRVTGLPVSDSIPRFAAVFADLARLAEDHGVRLAFENCPQGGSWTTGDWNIAHGPAAWERMFNAVDSPALGLEWEPCHQMCQLIEPLPQLEKWAARVFHVHGKDARVDRAVVAEYGVLGPEWFAWHKFPGRGDTDWREIFARLAAAGFDGTVDVEGWHDAEFRGDREWEGQRDALRYLQKCREE